MRTEYGVGLQLSCENAQVLARGLSRCLPDDAFHPSPEGWVQKSLPTFSRSPTKKSAETFVTDPRPSLDVSRCGSLNLTLGSIPNSADPMAEWVFCSVSLDTLHAT